MTIWRKLYVWFYLLRKVPIMPFLGIRYVATRDDYGYASIPRLWRNRNPFGITYFAALIAAGEMAAGVSLVGMVLDARKEGYKIGIVIRHCEASFLRPATGTVDFVCTDVREMRRLIEEIKLDGKNRTIETTSTGIGESSKTVCRVRIEWRLFRA